ncbi:hypothetical protein ACQB60_31445 [Actinomycetota bacterium Odt1-20B]
MDVAGSGIDAVDGQPQRPSLLPPQACFFLLFIRGEVGAYEGAVLIAQRCFVSYVDEAPASHGRGSGGAGLFGGAMSPRCR